MRQVRNRFLRFSLPIFLLVIFHAGIAHAWDVWTTSPWLALVTRFIGGVFVTVHPVEDWNDDGEPVCKVKANKISREARLIALDVAEASRLGFNEKEWDDLVFLYKKAPFDKEEADLFFTDPSALPFIAQRVFTVLSQFDPENYSYYQRRLSEFQTRLDSTVIVGRRLLGGLSLIYLGGSYSRMLTAAGCSMIPVNEEVELSWSRGEGLDRLASLLEDSRRNKILVVADVPPLKKVRESLKNNKDILFLERPALDQDMLLFFHGQYILLWNKVSAFRPPEGIKQGNKQ
ncbi:MAG: hypothetical protein QM446_06200 [Synergistota bacterium]|nr:hypothetical protein [Synergistota bacterium]